MYCRLHGRGLTWGVVAGQWLGSSLRPYAVTDMIIIWEKGDIRCITDKICDLAQCEVMIQDIELSPSPNAAYICACMCVYPLW